MQRENTFPIDHNALQTWFDAMMNSQSGINQIIAMAFRSNVQHVNFQTFYDLLMRVTSEIVNLCISREKYMLLIINESVTKSPTWVSMLIWPVIRQYVQDIRESTEIMNMGYDENRFMAVVVDDVSYSGAKLQQAISFPCCVCAAAMSSIARSKFGKNVIIPESMMRFETLWSNIEKAIEKHPVFSQDPKAIQEVFDELMQHELKSVTDAHVIYFDHKLADRFSTMQYLFATGIVPMGVQTEWVGPLIQGCEDDDYDTIKDTYETDYLWDRVCPPPYYKIIDLSWKGEVLDPDSDVTVFDLFKEWMHTHFTKNLL